MAAKKKDLGDYKLKISNYLRTKKKLLTPQGLNNAIGVDRKYVYDCRRRSNPSGTNWQAKFIKEYDKARAIISDAMLDASLVKPELIYQHWKLSYPNAFDLPDDDTKESNNIIINLQEIRKIENE